MSLNNSAVVLCWHIMNLSYRRRVRWFKWLVSGTQFISRRGAVCPNWGTSWFASQYVCNIAWVEFILLPTGSRPLHLGIGSSLGLWPDLILILSLVAIACFSSCRAPSLTRGRVCNLQCSRWLVRSLRTNNQTLLSHLRLCSLFVASYDSQGLRWRYSNPPPHGL
jgi:hypothetical protein